jgi:hypothetical protein
MSRYLIKYILVKKEEHPTHDAILWATNVGCIYVNDHQSDSLKRSRFMKCMRRESNNNMQQSKRDVNPLKQKKKRKEKKERKQPIWNNFN